MTQTINRQAVKAYAVALYELGLPKEDIETSVQIMESAPQLMEALSCPVVALKEKLRCVDRIFPESMRSFLKVVCTHGRWALLKGIFDGYKEYADSKKNVIHAVLRCVTPPDERQLEGFRRYVLRRFKADDVHMDIIKDPSLMGGFIIEAGGCEIDNSLRGRFNQLEQKLIRR